MASSDALIQRDHLPDLLLFEPTESWQTKQAFMRQAVSRLERGEHVYTVVDDNELLHFGWLIDSQERAYFSEIDQKYQYTKKGAVFYDFYTHPRARGQGLYQKSVAKMMNDAKSIADDYCAYISCLADNKASRHVIEKTGFSYVSSLYLRRVFGRTVKWQSGE